jgi:Protein of unknown function (DUF3619)
MNHVTNQDRARRTELLQSRFARRVASALTQHVALDARPDIDERLRVAREQALVRARTQRLAPAGGVIAMGGGTLALGGPSAGSDTPWWLRLSSLLPLAVLLAGLLLIDHQYTQSQIEAAAEVDAALLLDELPPEAYSDPGFAEFLKTARP